MMKYLLIVLFCFLASCKQEDNADKNNEAIKSNIVLVDQVHDGQIFIDVYQDKLRHQICYVYFGHNIQCVKEEK